MRQLTMSDIEFTIECLHEDTPVRGNYMVTDDNEADRAEENKILHDLECNDWAWCCVKVTGRFRGLGSSAYLGCCSHHNEQDFINGGYYDDMRQEVLDNLQAMLNDIENWSTTTTH